MTAPVPGGFIPPRGKPAVVVDQAGFDAAQRQARNRHIANLALAALAGLGAVAGLWVLWLHLTSDPLADVRAYFDAATRLDHGRPLYPAGANPDAADFYRYPPLLAIVLRPAAATLPFHVFAVLWEAVIVASFVATIRVLGAGRRTWLALGLLGIPIGWALAIGQAQVIVTLLLAVAQPWSIALAANLKLFPILVVVFWLGRRDWQAVGATIVWAGLILGAQLLLAPGATSQFLGTLGGEQVGAARNISPYGLSPILWVGLAAAGTIGAVLLAPSRWGWGAAVALGTLASPRLLVYMLGSLWAAIRPTDDAARPSDDAAGVAVRPNAAAPGP